ncbi:MAG: EamA family transporter [Alphaproteobacteria bacterium]
MVYLLAAFISSFFYASNVVIEDNLLSNNFKKISAMVFYISLLNCVFVPLLFVFDLPTFPSRNILFIYVLAGVVEIAYLCFYYAAMKIMDNSVVGALFSLGQVSIPVLSYFVLGERLLPSQYVGFLIVVTCAVALSLEKKMKLSLRLNIGFFYMLFAAILYSMMSVLTKYTINQGCNWVDFVVYQNIFSTFVAFVFLLSNKARKGIVSGFESFKERVTLLSINELLAFFALSFITFAVVGLSPVITASILSFSPFFILFLSFILVRFFGVKNHEKLSKKQIIKKSVCFLFIVIGIYLAISPVNS